MKEIVYFLNMDGIPGESTSASHKDEIELLSFSWGVSQAASASGAGGAAGKVEFATMHALARSSKASPMLFLACASGKHIKEAVLTVGRQKKKGKTQDILSIKLADVLISDYSVGGEKDTYPADHFDLSFSKIEMEYTQINADGSLEAPVKAGWDIKANKPA